jgi:hypothetical protein
MVVPPAAALIDLTAHAAFFESLARGCIGA